MRVFAVIGCLLLASADAYVWQKACSGCSAGTSGPCMDQSSKACKSTADLSLCCRFERVAAWFPCIPDTITHCLTHDGGAKDQVVLLVSSTKQPRSAFLSVPAKNDEQQTTTALGPKVKQPCFAGRLICFVLGHQRVGSWHAAERVVVRPCVCKRTEDSVGLHIHT
jgi:hypothetical protein